MFGTRCRRCCRKLHQSLSTHNSPAAMPASQPAARKQHLSVPYPPHPRRGVENQSRGKETKNNNNNTHTKKSWLISQEQQCQTWLASSTSKYILPTFVPPVGSLKLFTPPFRRLRAALGPYPCRTLPPAPGRSPSSLLCSGALVLLYKALNRPSPQPELAETILLGALVMS